MLINSKYLEHWACLGAGFHAWNCSTIASGLKWVDFWHSLLPFFNHLWLLIFLYTFKDSQATIRKLLVLSINCIHKASLMMCIKISYGWFIRISDFLCIWAEKTKTHLLPPKFPLWKDSIYSGKNPFCAFIIVRHLTSDFWVECIFIVILLNWLDEPTRKIMLCNFRKWCTLVIRYSIWMNTIAKSMIHLSESVMITYVET